MPNDKSLAIEWEDFCKENGIYPDDKVSAYWIKDFLQYLDNKYSVQKASKNKW